MNGSRQKELQYLRQRMAILDKVIAGFEQLAKEPAVTTRRNRWKCRAAAGKS